MALNMELTAHVSFVVAVGTVCPEIAHASHGDQRSLVTAVPTLEGDVGRGRRGCGQTKVQQRQRTTEGLKGPTAASFLI